MRRRRRGECGSSRSRITTASTAASNSWTAIPTATTYNVYRGDISLKSATYYGSCLQSGLPSPSFSDGASPIVNGGFFYLVTGKKDGIEGILGFRSDGTPRPNNSACP